MKNMVNILNKANDRYNRWLLALFLLTATLSIPAHSGAVDKISDEGCRCHQPMVESVLYKPYIHRPFLENKCLVCHADEGEITDASQRQNYPAPPTIKWFNESPTPATVHSFLITNMVAGDVLYVESSSAAGRLPRRQLAIPELASLPVQKPSLKAPAISDIQILAVRRELFLTATIGWHTDTLTDATVSYGLNNKLDQNITLQGAFLHDHRMTLVGLQANKIYKYTVASTNLAGQSTVSERKSFSTDHKIQTPMSKNEGFAKENTEKFVVSAVFFRYGDNYLLRLSSSLPATFYVGAPANQFENRQRGIKENPQTDHPFLGNDLITRSKACLKCHPDSEGTSSHPVNVFPPPGMEIPSEFPTMADGMITCMTCHAAHGSDFEYRLLKRDKRDLCIGCHKEMA